MTIGRLVFEKFGGEVFAFRPPSGRTANRSWRENQSSVKLDSKFLHSNFFRSSLFGGRDIRGQTKLEFPGPEYGNPTRVPTPITAPQKHYRQSRIIKLFNTAATVLSLLHRLTVSCAGLTAGSLMFAGPVLQPTSRQPAATTRCDRRPGCEIVKIIRDLQRLWWRRQLIERDALIYYQTAKIARNSKSRFFLKNRIESGKEISESSITTYCT